ncbi:MAG TPA: AsmA family protein [Burkholderiales bacterium]|nr:AsmA family protein [Burkholderiales bacterium]
MKWLKRIAIPLGVLVAVLAIVPLLLPLNSYIPRVQKEAADVLGEPVSIDSLHASAFPIPHVRIDGIAIGESQDIKIGKVTFTPDLWSLLTSEKTIRRVDVDNLTLSKKAFGILAALTQQKSDSAKIRVQKIQIHAATVKLEQSSFGPFDLRVQLSSPEEPGELLLTTQDGTLKARAVPEGERYTLAIAARGWTPPLGPAIRFDELDIKGTASSKGADLNGITGKLYGGVLAGKVRITAGKELALRGNLDLKQIELKHAVALVSPKTRVSGRLDAKPVFSSHAKNAAQLGEALKLETPFSVQDGVLYGFDLKSAAVSFGRQGSGGGETRFNELAGQLAMERGAYRFTELKVASSGVAARGNVTIAASRALSGQLNTNVKALGTATSIPLVVAGTLDTPMLYPNPTALAGAAAGTVILPGVGTAAGAKLGEFVDGLFGKSRRQP